MKKAFVVALVIFCNGVIAQTPEYLHFESPSTKINHSIFSVVEVADTRFDDVYMGFVQKGAFNRKAPVELEQPMTQAIKEFAGGLIANADKQDGAVLINIRDFFLYEAEKMTAETGTFIFRAGCYFRMNDSYHLLFSIDTSITVKSNWDVTKKLKQTACDALGSFIKKAAEFDKNAIREEVWTYADILDIDMKEKADIPVYNVTLPKKGLYKDYAAFKMNQPSDTSFIEEAGRRNTPAFYTKADNGKKGKAVTSKNYFAACDGGKLYFITSNGVYEGIKRDGDFYFTGTIKDASNASMASTAYFMFGIMGGIIASASMEHQILEYRIDHTNGKFLPIKKI